MPKERQVDFEKDQLCYKRSEEGCCAHCSNILKVFIGQVWSNLNKQRRWTLLAPLHFITGSLNLDCPPKEKRKWKEYVSLHYAKVWTILERPRPTFLTRSFKCFLPWSIRNPGVFGEETLITCQRKSIFVMILAASQLR